MNRDSQLRTAYVSGVSFSKLCKVFTASPYVDDDEQVIKVDQVHFRGVEPELLHWLFFLQNMSDRLPNSRFSHPKLSHMSISINSLCFGTEPTDDSDTALGDMFTPEAAVTVARGMMKKARESRGAQQVVMEHRPMQDTSDNSDDSRPADNVPSVGRMEGESDFLYTLRSVAAAATGPSTFADVDTESSPSSKASEEGSYKDQHNPGYESAINRQALLCLRISRWTRAEAAIGREGTVSSLRMAW